MNKFSDPALNGIGSLTVHYDVELQTSLALKLKDIKCVCVEEFVGFYFPDEQKGKHVSCLERIHQMYFEGQQVGTLYQMIEIPSGVVDDAHFFSLSEKGKQVIKKKVLAIYSIVKELCKTEQTNGGVL